MKKTLLILLLCVPLMGFGQINEFPSRYSLESFTPSSIKQVGQMCESYALSTIRTIIYAKNNNNVDSLWIEQNRFSPFFLYYMYVGSKNQKCKVPCPSRVYVNPDKTDEGYGKIVSYYGLLQFMKDYGIAKMSNVESNEYYPSTNKKLWRCYPSDSSGMKSDLLKAKQYRIDSFQFVGNNFKKLRKSGVDSIKSNLLKGNPCMLNIGFNDKWPEKYRNKELAKGIRNYNGKGVGHSMVIIAYDDNKFGGSFLVMNSYGVKWGIDGKIWIKYKDIKRLKGNSVISISSNKETSTSEDRSPNYLDDLKSKKFRKDYFRSKPPVFKFINDQLEKKCTFN